MTSKFRIIAILAICLVLCSYQKDVCAQTSAAHPGLKTVVIDPGHGGKDSGSPAKGKSIHEKHIVLSVSKLLGEKIKAAYPDVKVIYTRSNDTFIGLHDRAMVARRNNADLFISIHCNGSSSAEAKGSSVHILGQNSNNSKNKTDYFERNMSVAQRENSVIVMEDDYKTRYQSFDPNSPESYISHQLQWMAYYESSLLFASEVVEHLICKPLIPRRIVIDQDIFQVLVEANMPAVLIELAFVTNPIEYKYLASSEGQKEMADRLFKAFKSYKTKYDASVNVVKADVPVQADVQQVETASSSPQSDTYYSIQIMGLSRLLSEGDAAFKGLDVHHVKKVDSKIYKYVCGKYDTIEAAKGNLSAVRKKFPEAFVVRVENNDVKRAE